MRPEAKTINKVNYDILGSLKKPGLPVIIYALPQEAEAIAYACKDEGITVAAFCDNEKRKSEKLYCGLEVVHTPNLPSRFPKARVIIAHQNLTDSSDQLMSLGYDEIYSPLELFKKFNVMKYEYKQAKVTKTYMATKIEVSKKNHELFFDDAKTFLRSLDLMITTKCSMNCESCANLMQYYK